MSEVENHTLRPLQAMREEIAQGFAAVNDRVGALETRVEAGFTEVNRRLDAQRRVWDGESVMARYTVSEVEERLAAIERHLGFPERPA